MKLSRLSKKDWKERYPGSRFRSVMGRVEYSEETGEYEVVVPIGASTKTILHEMGHAKSERYGKEPGREAVLTLEEFVPAELEVEEYVRSVIGVGGINIFDAMTMGRGLMEKYGTKPNEAFTKVINALASEGYELDRGERRELWWDLRDFWELKRSTNR